MTDNGNYILDCKFDGIGDARELDEKLCRRAGIVESGLFIDLADEALSLTRTASPQSKLNGPAGSCTVTWRVRVKTRWVSSSVKVTRSCRSWWGAVCQGQGERRRRAGLCHTNRILRWGDRIPSGRCGYRWRGIDRRDRLRRCRRLYCVAHVVDGDNVDFEHGVADGVGVGVIATGEAAELEAGGGEEAVELFGGAGRGRWFL